MFTDQDERKVKMRKIKTKAELKGLAPSFTQVAALRMTLCRKRKQNIENAFVLNNSGVQNITRNPDFQRNFQISS